MTLGCKTSKDVMKAIKDHGVQMIDIRFTDMPGMWQHTSYPTQVFEQDAIDDGLGFDGSSIRGFKAINESDMLLQPDPATAFIDPFMAYKTLVMIADIKDPVTKEFYSRDPRGIAKKAEAYLKSTGIADTAYFGPEAEFFVFDNVQYGTGQHYSTYSVDSKEGHWNTNRDEGPNLGYKIRPKEGYFPCPPNDTLKDLRAEMALKMIEVGLTVECHHHEVATAGQCEIDMKFDSLLAMADHLMMYKYIVRNVAGAATARPRPSCPSRSSATTAPACTATSRSGRPASRCSPTRPAMPGLSPDGDMVHRRPAAAQRRRSWPSPHPPPTPTGAWCRATRPPSTWPTPPQPLGRLPHPDVFSDSPKAKRVEFRCPDPSCNPYLAFAAMLMAGLDGIKNKIDPGDPVDKDIYDLPPEEAAEIKQVPGSLEASLAALEADHEFLLEGDVFSADLIDTYIDYKRSSEVDPIRLRPHPYEFFLYYDL